MTKDHSDEQPPWREITLMKEHLGDERSQRNYPDDDDDDDDDDDYEK